MVEEVSMSTSLHYTDHPALHKTEWVENQSAESTGVFIVFSGIKILLKLS